MAIDERRAREVTLLEAFESAVPPSPSWSDDDRAWADRVAREAAEPGTPVDRFAADRARHALHRLGEREPALARIARRPAWRRGALTLVLAAGFGLGIVADAIGAGQRINLLAPPLWGVLVWNLAVYVSLVVLPLAGLVRGRRTGSGRGPNAASGSGPLARFAQRLAQRGAGLSRLVVRAKDEAVRGFATLWLQRSGGLALLRGETLLHAGAAAVGAGLVAGLYARGLVLDYRVGWESTLLDADAAHALVSTVFGPASALSGIALPDADGFAAMRTAFGEPGAGAPAAPWLHLIALTIALVVALPRLVLALGCAWVAQWQSRRFVLPLESPYFQRLARLRGGQAARVVVLPYAATLSPQATLGLRAWLVATLGAGVEMSVAPATAFGADDVALPPLPASTTHALVLFDMAATPEVEHHGRFLATVGAALPAGCVLQAVVDASAFTRRFTALGDRVGQRSEAWRRLGRDAKAEPQVVDLEAQAGGVAEGVRA